VGSLNLSVEELKDRITSSVEYWEYNFGTNCYAFALGLDILEHEITKNAYQLGVIGAVLNNIPFQNLEGMTFEQRMILDLDALNISYSTSDFCDCTNYKIYYDKNGNAIEEEYYWIIALFSNENDFHFLRKAFDGSWWHKRGCFGCPIDFDSDRNKIVSPKECNIEGYKYVKTYRLCRREKYKPLF